MQPRDDNQGVEIADAARARALEKTRMQWLAYIAEQREELAAQKTEADPDADLTGSGRPAPRKAQLDQATRQAFGAIVEARRQQWMTRAEQEARVAAQAAPDGSVVYSDLLARFVAELNGQVHPGGKALLYISGQPKPVAFDFEQVRGGTTEADFLSAKGTSGPTRQQAFLALGLVAVLLGVLVFLAPWFFGSETATTSEGATEAIVGGESTPLWTVERAQVGAQSGPARLLGGYPTILCLGDRRAAAPVAGETVVLTGTQAIRRYQVQPGTPARATDLALADCETNPPTLKAAARLVETRTRTLLATETLLALAVRGADLDPQAIPPGQMEVTIDVAIQDASAGTLITADGQRWAATRSEVLEGGTHLIYLVPLAESTQPAGWEISSAGDLPGFLSLQLPAPESRAAILRRVLDVHTGVASIAIHDDVMEATIVLTVTLDTQAAPLTLLPGDLVVERGGAASEARWDPPALTPGQSTTIEVRVPLRTGDTLDIALASWRARLTTE